MIAEARSRGYITYDQLNTVLPPDQVSSEQIETLMSMLRTMGINVIEDDEAEEGEDGAKGSTDGGRDLHIARGGRFHAPKPRSSTAPTTRCACICARWGPSNCSAARARIAMPSGSVGGPQSTIDRGPVRNSPLTFSGDHDLARGDELSRRGYPPARRDRPRRLPSAAARMGYDEDESPVVASVAKVAVSLNPRGKAREPVAGRPTALAIAIG